MVNYNLQLYYREGKTNIDVDAFWMVSWPQCVPKTLGTHHQVTAVAVQTLQEATLKGPAIPTEVFSCNEHILDPVGDGPQVTCMTIDDWHQAQWAAPVLGLVISRMQDGILGQFPLKQTDPPELWQFLQEYNHLKLRWGILYRKILPKELQEAQF